MQVSRGTLRLNGSRRTICWMVSIDQKEHECKDSRSRHVFYVCEIQLDWFGPTVNGDLYFEECFRLVNAFDLSQSFRCSFWGASLPRRYRAKSVRSKFGCKLLSVFGVPKDSELEPDYGLA